MVPVIPLGHGVTSESSGTTFIRLIASGRVFPHSKLPSDIEGGSIAGSARDGRRQGHSTTRRDWSFTFRITKAVTDRTRHCCSANLKLLKFYETNRLALFDIEADISERNDLATQMPEKAAALDALLVRYLTEVDAQFAVTNPQYDPLVHRPRGKEAEAVETVQRMPSCSCSISMMTASSLEQSSIRSQRQFGNAMPMQTVSSRWKKFNPTSGGGIAVTIDSIDRELHSFC